MALLIVGLDLRPVSEDVRGDDAPPVVSNSIQ